MFQILKGSRYFLKGFSLIFKPGIRKWVVIPLGINFFLFGYITYVSWVQFQTFTKFIMDRSQILYWLMLPIFTVTAIIVVFFTFTFMANLIGGPFNDSLAKAVENHLRDKTVNFPTAPWYDVITKYFWYPITKLFYYLWWAFILLIVSLIPIINIISPILWFLFGAWLISLEYANAPFGNHGKNPPTVRKILAKQRMLAFGFGSTALLIMLIPVVNLLVMPVAVAGATYMWVYEFADKYHENSTL